MKRAFLGLGLAAVVAHTATATDYDGYSITYPEGWSIYDPDASGMSKAVAADGASNCNSYRAPRDSLAGISQAELNEALASPWGKSEWASFTGVAPDQLEIVESHVRAIGAYQLRTATIAIPSGIAEGNNIPMKVYAGLTIVPGAVYYAGCYASMDRYEAHRASFEATVDSLRPRQAVAAPPARNQP
jgi:hypothetical protein